MILEIGHVCKLENSPLFNSNCVHNFCCSFVMHTRSDSFGLLLDNRNDEETVLILFSCREQGCYGAPGIQLWRVSIFQVTSCDLYYLNYFYTAVTMKKPRPGLREHKSNWRHPTSCISFDKGIWYEKYQKGLMGCNSQSLINTANYQWQFYAKYYNFSAQFQLGSEGCPRVYFSSSFNVLKLDRAKQCMGGTATNTQNRAQSLHAMLYMVEIINHTKMQTW